MDVFCVAHRIMWIQWIEVEQCVAQPWQTIEFSRIQGDDQPDLPSCPTWLVQKLVHGTFNDTRPGKR
jgi:hypothetical protein